MARQEQTMNDQLKVRREKMDELREEGLIPLVTGSNGLI